MEIPQTSTSNSQHLLQGQTSDLPLHEDRDLTPEYLSGDEGEGHGGHAKCAAKIGVLKSALNIANTIVGAGILALPVVMAQYGILMGSTIIAGSCLLTYCSCCILLKAKNLSRHSKYNSISKHCFGFLGLWLVKAIIIINNIGLSIIYLIIFSNVMSNIISAVTLDCELPSAGSTHIYCSSASLKVIGATFMLPFIFSKDMAKLSKVSIFGVFAIVIFSFITVGYFGYSVSQGTNAKSINILPNIDNPLKALACVTSVFLAFTFQFNFFPVYKSLENPTDNRMRKVTRTALMIVLTIFLTVAITGYLTFGSSTDNLLTNFTLEKLGLPAFMTINIAFLISSTASFPLMFFQARNNIYGAIMLLRKRLNQKKEKKATNMAESKGAPVVITLPSDENDTAAQSNSPTQLGIQNNQTSSQIDMNQVDQNEGSQVKKYGFGNAGYYAFVLILYAITILMAIYIPGIQEVFDFVGSTAANGLNFLLPTAFYMKLCSKKGKYRRLSAIIFGIGVVMGIVGIVCSTLEVVG